MIDLPWAIVNDAHEPMDFWFGWNCNAVGVDDDDWQR
jgi:hypothetical protein